MANRNKNKKSQGSYARALIYPTVAVGAGVGLGSLAGGLAARGIANLPGIRAKLQSMSPAQRRSLLTKIKRTSQALGTTAGAASGAATINYLQNEVEKLQGRRQKSGQTKTADIYAVYFKAMEELL